MAGVVRGVGAAALAAPADGGDSAADLRHDVADNACSCLHGVADNACSRRHGAVDSACRPNAAGRSDRPRSLRGLPRKGLQPGKSVEFASHDTPVGFDRGGVGFNCCGDITGRIGRTVLPSRMRKAGRTRPLRSVVGKAARPWLVDAIGRRRRRRSASAVERFSAGTRRWAMPGIFARAIPVARPTWTIPVAGAASRAVPTARAVPGAIPVSVIPVVHTAREGHNTQGRSHCGQSISGHMKLHIANRPCVRCGPTSLRLHCMGSGCA